MTRLIDRLRARERAELNLNFCARIPVHTISTSIGMSGDDSLKFCDAYVKSSGIGRITPELQRAAGLEVRRRSNIDQAELYRAGSLRPR